MERRRAHPTVRPHALALGVLIPASLDEVPREGLCPPLSEAAGARLARAMLKDTLTGLVTFPVRYRFAFVAPDLGPLRELDDLASETWKRERLIGKTARDRWQRALATLIDTHAESVLLVRGDVPVLPLGELFDAMLWALGQPRLALGALETGEPYAVVTAKRGKATEALPEGAADDIVQLAVAEGFETKQLPAGFRVHDIPSVERLLAAAKIDNRMTACRTLVSDPELRAYAGGG